MNNAKLALSTLASTAQTSAAPMIEKLTGKIQELTQWFTSLSPAQQETVLKVGLVVAAIGPLSIGFGKVAKGISDTVTTGQKFVSGAAKIIAKITAKTAATAAGTAADTAGTAATAAHTAATTAATATTGGMTVAQTALNAVMNLCPIILIVTLIAGLIAAGVALYKNWDKVKNIIYTPKRTNMSSKRLKRENNSTNTQQFSMSRSWREQRSRMVLNHRSRQSRHVLSLHLRVRDGMSEYVPSQRKEPSTSRRVSPHGMSCKSASQHTAASASSIH